MAILEGSYDAATGNYCFETDCFSDYAIAYKDTVRSQENTNGGSHGSANSQTQAGGNEAATPKTGDTAPVMQWMVSLLAAAVVLFLVIWKKKWFVKR